jgi:tetratricopeptide (TPR) repeat protein
MWIRWILIIILLQLSLQSVGQSNNDIQLANEYYSTGELSKAREIYEQVIQNPQAIPLVHENYLNTLIDQEDYTEAEKYLRRVIKLIPGNIEYQLDLGYLMLKRGETQKSDEYFRKFIDYYKQDIYKIRLSAQYFVNNRLTEYAILSFKSGRESLGNPNLFSLEMANLYRMNGEKTKMVQEYLRYVTQNPKNVNYVKNTLQNLLTEPEEFEELESSLLEKVQEDPENEIYGELLIWVNLQQKNFYGAFIQSRALDIRSNSPGSRSLQIGFLALQNGDYKNARRIFQYVMDEYPTSPNYKMANLYYIQSKELEAKQTYPID